MDASVEPDPLRRSLPAESAPGPARLPGRWPAPKEPVSRQTPEASGQGVRAQVLGRGGAFVARPAELPGRRRSNQRHWPLRQPGTWPRCRRYLARRPRPWSDADVHRLRPYGADARSALATDLAKRVRRPRRSRTAHDGPCETTSGSQPSRNRQSSGSVLSSTAAAGGRRVSVRLHPYRLGARRRLEQPAAYGRCGPCAAHGRLDESRSHRRLRRI